MEMWVEIERKLKGQLAGAVAEEVRQKLVLRGCGSLAPIVKDRLRLSVLKGS